MSEPKQQLPETHSILMSKLICFLWKQYYVHSSIPMFLFYQGMRSDKTIVGKTLRLMQFTFNVNKENGR